ncbi:hypothetical protein PI124_g5775 [Phytophthora idaei]|nr:hypothetical protein PI125_g5276 [Phytophthora idaei]KAG3161900.1 hypothetical protein PI126_g6216 [Phytophthora idaei]KAG3249553.1 hypothetical protein PI124_g5775 [Phytophthora idaei]
MRFSIIPFEGIASVKQIFDLVVSYFSNMEISVSEELEALVTVRENDDDTTIDSITQNVMMSTTIETSVKKESNTAMFSEFCERDDIPCSDRDYGVVGSEFVDNDERYSYRPKERVRKDVNGVIEVTWLQPPKGLLTRTFWPGSRLRRRGTWLLPGYHEMVVVMTRWVHNTLHQPEFPMTVEGWQYFC